MEARGGGRTEPRLRLAGRLAGTRPKPSLLITPCLGRGASGRPDLFHPGSSILNRRNRNPVQHHKGAEVLFT